MKKSLKILFILTVMFATVSCDQTFEEINQSKNSPENVSVNVLLPAAMYTQFDNFGGRREGFMGTFTQHFAGFYTSGVNADQYVIDNNSFSFLFTSLYSGPLNSYKDIITRAEKEGSWHYVGVAKILTALALGTLTDVYGEIPWKEALDANNVFPVYDSQEFIYSEIQRLLAEAIVDLGKSSFRPLADGDFIRGGNVNAWITIAHLLGARYENHLSKIDPAGSATRALAHVDAAKAAGISSSTDLKMRYEGTSQISNRWYTLWQDPAIVASKNLLDIQVSQDDPRLESYWSPNDSQTGTYIGFVGKPNGTGAEEPISAVGPEGWYGKPNSDHMVATYFELLFIEAEAAFRLNDLPRAATAHNAAVKEQIELVVNDPADTRIATYLATYANESAVTISIEKIMTEKWKAMFTMEEETWTDMRRHNFQYPNWISIPKKNDGTPVASEYIRRLLYPQDELDKNPKNVPEVAGIFERLWWDQ
ncbi:MAG: SusD/RagB family nutrient-binding outer membrane lipoprotein [Cyclobacteriaceae bacterium]|nr:SusD/RagB family nutrient-binding outer membrane lipoprotein [Cyclobacteriaceae bacterium]